MPMDHLAHSQNIPNIVYHHLILVAALLSNYLQSQYYFQQQLRPLLLRHLWCEIFVIFLLSFPQKERKIALLSFCTYFLSEVYLLFNLKKT